MSYETLFVHQLQSELDRHNFAILDMRDKSSYEREHLEGAQLVDDNVIKKLLRTHKKDEPILIYCYHGNSSRDLASFFCSIGFTRVFNLDGGWQAWNNYIATSDAISPDENELHNWLLSQKFATNNVNHRIRNGMTPLMLAALQGNSDFVKKLIEAGGDINLKNDDGNNALWFAAVSESIEIINILINNDIDINNTNINGVTTLIYAASAGKITMVKTLVDAGADVSVTTEDGFNALDLASNLSTLKFLKPIFTQH